VKAWQKLQSIFSQSAFDYSVSFKVKFSFSQDIKILLVRLIEEIGESTRVAAFDAFIANMCHDMAKSEILIKLFFYGK